MKRLFMWLVLVGAVICFIGVFWQAFSIVAYVRSGSEDWLDAHGGSWVNGFHGLLALVILLSALAYAQWAARKLGLRQPGGAAGSA